MSININVDLGTVINFLLMNKVQYNWRAIEFEDSGLQEYLTVGNVIIPNRFVKVSSSIDIFSTLEALSNATTEDEL